MTREEAIERIRDFGLYHAISDLPYSMRTVEAFEMAIKALEQPEIIRCKDCRYNAELAEYIKDYYGCDYHEHIVSADGFCDNAKRREESEQE